MSRSSMAQTENANITKIFPDLSCATYNLHRSHRINASSIAHRVKRITKHGRRVEPTPIHIVIGIPLIFPAKMVVGWDRPVITFIPDLPAVESSGNHFQQNHLHQTMDECIRVAVRVRPANASEKDEPNAYRLDIASKKVIQEGKELKEFGPFHHVFGPEAKNTDVFDEAIKRILDNVLKGYNGNLFRVHSFETAQYVICLCSQVASWPMVKPAQGKHIRCLVLLH